MDVVRERFKRVEEFGWFLPEEYGTISTPGLPANYKYYKKAAVACVIARGRNGLQVLVTKRSNKVGTHAGRPLADCSLASTISCSLGGFPYTPVTKRSNKVGTHAGRPLADCSLASTISCSLGGFPYTPVTKRSNKVGTHAGRPLADCSLASTISCSLGGFPCTPVSELVLQAGLCLSLLV